MSHEDQAGGVCASRGYASHVLNTITKQAQRTHGTTNVVHVNLRDTTSLEKNATSSISIQSEENQKNSWLDHSAINNEENNMFQFLRTQSSPKLTVRVIDDFSQI